MSHASSSPDDPVVKADDPRVQEIVEQAQKQGGVILTGPPGTSKSYYAAAAAEIIVSGVKERRWYVQFHGSYQYEDFMVGYAPTDTTFKLKDGPFMQALRAAHGDREHLYVLVIDELSRADVGRVFGEVLTYVERSKRELEVTIASGEKIVIPSNLVLIMTMNPYDRGVDEVDAAFERRFSKIAMDPDATILEERLVANGLDDALRARVMGWFKRINAQAVRNPAASVGHAYLWDVIDEDSLREIWSYQLQFLVRRAFRRDEALREEIEAAWEQIFITAPADGDADADTGATPES
jgi:5-methylcytosine-specific restriction protein B